VQFVRTPPQRISLWLNGSESEQIGIRKVTVSRICLIASTWEYQVLKMYAPTLTFPIHTYSSIFPNAMASPSSRLYAAPPMERREFSSWDEFFSYMEEYQQKTDQVRCPPSHVRQDAQSGAHVRRRCRTCAAFPAPARKLPRLRAYAAVLAQATRAGGPFECALERRAAVRVPGQSKAAMVIMVL